MDIQPLVENNNTFALDLYANLSTSEDNLCISPFGVSTALAMTFAGARGNTEKQMKDVMQVSMSQYEFHKNFARLLGQISTVGQGIELLLAHSIFPHNNYPFLESFVSLLRENYKTTLAPLKYSEPEKARKTINQWVSEKTQEHISELIPVGMLTPLTRLVLVNAIYFKGLWEKPFDKRDTMNSPFRVSNEKLVNVPMMRQKAEFKYTKDDFVQILELPYQGKSLSLILILPKDGDDLAKVEKALSFKKLSSWSKNMFEATVDVHLPLFKIKSNFILNDTLISMGMSDAFNVDRADFSGMDGMTYPEGLYISDTMHQADIEVNEEGATATAATAVVLALRGLPQEYQFHANHPFIFLLRENTTGTILFIGKVLNPLS